MVKMKKAIIIGLICIVLLTIFISGCSENKEQELLENEFSTDYPVIKIENHSTEYYITLDCGYVRNNLDNRTIFFMPETIDLCMAMYPQLWNNSDEDNESILLSANPDVGVGMLTREIQILPKFSIDCDSLIDRYANESNNMEDCSMVTVPIVIDCLEWEKNPPNSDDLKRIHSCVIVKGIKYGECEAN